MLYTALGTAREPGLCDPTSVPAAQRFRAPRTAGLASGIGTSQAPQSAVLLHDRELWRLGRVRSIFGGTTEIQKEIIARGLGL
jgi:alkylation response protein AidB-like acyl-CoA dehydrogenase